ncbi:hypothetical protein CSUB01_11862 [Colletotrichum sublineola]|uniref:Uncharacterized protein n=1 Tax=Colletotrichum sublineola TaxID=1173701 RepID=A0A066X182_COLSU|nr:hypothetical protein CSUB01_11862 [Colletotrichum sublineola]
MKFPALATTSSLVLLLSLAKNALSCAVYTNCHCYDSNGTPNNNATQTACQGYQPSDTSFVAEKSACYYIGPPTTGPSFGPVYMGMNNCDFRVLCAQAGATGSDSSCAGKLPQRCRKATATPAAKALGMSGPGPTTRGGEQLRNAGDGDVVQEARPRDGAALDTAVQRLAGYVTGCQGASGGRQVAAREFTSGNHWFAKARRAV